MRWEKDSGRMPLAYLAPPAFFVIAYVFSMLGMGGSQLYIPILYWLGMDFKTEAIPLGMLLNVVNSSSAALTYGRKGFISWRVAMPFAVTMVLFAPLGVRLNITLPEKPLLVFFAVFTAAAAMLMLSGWKPARRETDSRPHLLVGTVAGSVLGTITGMIGRGGGSFIVPILYLLGLGPRMAAATSSFVVTCSGLSSFLAHLVTAAQPDWVSWLLCVAAVLLGSQLGSRRMATKMSSKDVKRVFGFVLLGVSALILLKDVVFG